MHRFIQLFEEYSSKKSIKDLGAKRDRPMVEGVAEILLGIRDRANRLELARKQVLDFKREGIVFDYAEFYALCGLAQ